MKKILCGALSAIALNSYALETHLATSIMPCKAKLEHSTLSFASHGFYIHNNTTHVRHYRWFIKQCLMHYGVPNVCAVNESNYLTLEPDQVFEFHKQTINHITCGGLPNAVATYAVSHLEDDKGQAWEVPAESVVVCG